MLRNTTFGIRKFTRCIFIVLLMHKRDRRCISFCIIAHLAQQLHVSRLNQWKDKNSLCLFSGTRVHDKSYIQVNVENIISEKANAFTVSMWIKHDTMESIQDNSVLLVSRLNKNNIALDQLHQDSVILVSEMKHDEVLGFCSMRWQNKTI